MLTRRATTEVLAAHHDIAFLHVRGEALIDIHHAMLRKLFGLERIQITRGDNHIRIDIIAIAPDFTFILHKIASYMDVRLA